MKNMFLTPLNRTTTRSAFSVLLLFITMVIILFYLAQNYRANLIDFRKRELKRQVEISLHTIDPILSQYRLGEINREQAFEKVTELVRRMTYTGESMNNYIFMSSYEGIMLVQPLEPQKQGTYQLEARDSYGNYYIKDLIKVASSDEGEGFVSYFYPPPGAETPGEKLSFVRGIPELQCYIGTGMFFEDVNKLFREYLLGPLLIIIIGFTSIYVLIIIYMRPLIKCFQLLLNAFHRVSLNPDTNPDLPGDAFPENSDEAEIIKGFETMLEKVNSSTIELRNSEKRYKYLYEESQGVRVIIDKDGIVSGTNKSFLVALGYDGSRFNGNSLYRLFCAGQNERIKKMIDNAFMGTYDQALDFDLPDVSGNNRTVLISDALVVPENNSKILLTGVDITNRKIVERKAEIQKEQLIQADKLSSLGVLVSGVAHEINNPNQFILSNAGLVEDLWEDIIPVLEDYYKKNGDFLIRGVEYSEMKNLIPEYLSAMTEGSRRIGKIVSDLKSLSRNDSKQPWANFNVNTVLESSINLCMNMIKKATDVFSLQLDTTLPAVCGNSQQIEQVFINLIQNSVQSIKERGKAISISTSLNEKGMIEILFSDQGCGIKKDDLRKVFDPFYTTKRETGGTGIGLSISKNIIDEHGGRMNYRSIENEGTNASVYLKPSGTKLVEF